MFVGVKSYFFWEDYLVFCKCIVVIWFVIFLFIVKCILKGLDVLIIFFVIFLDFVGFFLGLFKLYLWMNKIF